MEDIFASQKIMKEALHEDMWNIGVYKIAALKVMQENAPIMEVLGEKIDGLGPNDPVEITYGELDSVLSLHVANIYLALTSDGFRNSPFADDWVHICRNMLKKEISGILEEIQKQQTEKQ